MSDAYRSLLQFRRPEFSVGLKRMLSSFSSEEARETFYIDPVGTIARNFPETVGKLSIDKVSEANRLVLSLLANDRFRTWAADYSNSIQPESLTIDRLKVRMDLAKAILETGDEKIIYALLGSQTRSEGLTTDDIQGRVDSVMTVEVAIAAIAVAVIHMVITVIDFTPRTPAPIPELQIMSSDGGNELRSISDQLIRSAKKFRGSEL